MTNQPNPESLIAALQNIRGIPAGPDAFNKAQKIACEALAALPTATPDPDAVVRLHEVACDLPSLFGRASLEGHEVGQRLAREVQAKMREALAATSTQQGGDPVECETCNGIGTIDERLGGYPFSNPEAKCPDCHGYGEYTPAARAEGVDAAKRNIYGGLDAVMDVIDVDNGFRTYPWTYQNQPGNVGASVLGQACMRAKPGGDSIDHGLSLLQELQRRGLGIVRVPKLADAQESD